MGSVTVRANRGIHIARFGGFGMHAVQCFLIVGGVALAAG